VLNALKLLLRGVEELGLRPTWHAVRYHVRKLWWQVRFGRYRLPPAEGADVARPGAVQGYRQDGQTVTVDCAGGRYALTVLAPDVIRVHFAPAGAGGAVSGPAYEVARPDDAWSPCDVEVVEVVAGEASLELHTARLTCRVARASGRLTFLDADGELVNEDAAGAGAWAGGPDGNGGPATPVICQKRIQPDERFYGLGERACGLDRRGRVFQSWNSDPQVYELGQDPLYLCIPFLLGLHSDGRQGYGLLFHNTFRGRFDLGAGQADTASFTAVGGELCYTFIYGPALRTVVERYTALTGRTPLLPRWALGYHQSRWSYYPEARVRRLADDFRREHDVPCDAVHLDIHYMDGYRCFTWDDERFPDPAGLVADLHRDGFKVVVILDAGIKADPSYAVYRSGLEEDVFVTLPNGRLVRGPVWPGDSAFPDFTAPRARAWWRAWVRKMAAVGIDGIWNDMNEPAVFGLEGTTLPDAARHNLDGCGGDHAEAHNVFGMQMARATAEGLAEARPDQRPFAITRSGWAGVQRHAVGWTGDNAATWEQLWLTLPMVMNLGLSGLAFTGPDVGGFFGHPGAELFTRWLQMAVFLPFFRAHTHLGDPDQEPWSWGEPRLSINRRWIEHRYRLLPYLYTALWQCSQTGLPMARPLLLAFQDDSATHELDDQFLCGDHLLVAPILEEGATQRTVYLPAGGWYDVWSDQRLSGPARVEVQAPLERIPVFARAGAVVPTGPPMAYVGERPVDPLTLHVYPPAADHGEPQVSVLYEDDGETYAYREGDVRLTRFTLRAEGAPLTRLQLQREVEGRYRPDREALRVVVHGVERAPHAVNCDGERIEVGELDGDRPALRLRAAPFETLTLDWS
jgi:alpha-glucosidase